MEFYWVYFLLYVHLLVAGIVAETGTSTTTPSTKTGTSTTTPSAETGTSTTTPSAKTGTSTTTPSGETGTSTATPSAETGTSTTTPSAKTGTRTTTPSAETGTSTTTPSGSEFTEDLSNYGTEFYFGMTNNMLDGSRTLHIASEGAGTLRVQVPIIQIDEEVDLLKGYTIYKIYVTFPWRMNVYISTSIPVAITVVDEESKNRYSNGVFLALPVAFAGTSFMTAGAKGWYFGIAVMAIYDNTTVTLMDLYNNTETTALDRLGLLYTRDYPDMTGTTVSANKPVTVNSGTTVHRSDSGMSIEQMLPYEAWTNLYIVPPLSTKSKYSIRTLSMDTQNVCFRNSTSKNCLQITKADSNSTFSFGTEPVEVSSSSRVSVIQYQIADSRFGAFDSVMIVIPGIKNYLNTYRFAIPNKPYSNPYIVVIVLSSEANEILLDKSYISYDVVHNITTSVGKYSVLMKTVTAGYHELRHTNAQVRFGALAYGFDGKKSYAFPLGFTYTRSVNDSLSGWSAWSACSVSCGEGFQTRTRPCDSQNQLSTENSCNGEERQTQTCYSQACQGTPFGSICIPERDTCEGTNTVCLGGKCRCSTDHYYDGEDCLSRTSICPTCSQGRSTIIVGAVMGVVILALAVYAVYISVLLRRKSSSTGLNSQQRSNYENQGNLSSGENQGDLSSGARVAEDASFTIGNQYMVLYKNDDTDRTYDVIQSS